MKKALDVQAVHAQLAHVAERHRRAGWVLDGDYSKQKTVQNLLRLISGDLFKFGTINTPTLFFAGSRLIGDAFAVLKLLAFDDARAEEGPSKAATETQTARE